MTLANDIFGDKYHKPYTSNSALRGLAANAGTAEINSLLGYDDDLFAENRLEQAYANPATFLAGRNASKTALYNTSGALYAAAVASITAMPAGAAMPQHLQRRLALEQTRASIESGKQAIEATFPSRFVEAASEFNNSDRPAPMIKLAKKMKASKFGKVSKGTKIPIIE